MKNFFVSIFILITLIFNVNLKAQAFEEKISLEKSNIFFVFVKNDNKVIELFSPDNNNLETLVAITLSIIPSFGVGHFWLGSQDEGWFFLKLDFVMLALPILITAISTIFSSFNVIKNSTESMSNQIDIFSILGLTAWASSLGVRIWETSSVIRYANSKKTNIDKKELKVGFTNQGLTFNLASF